MTRTVKSRRSLIVGLVTSVTLVLAATPVWAPEYLPPGVYIEEISFSSGVSSHGRISISGLPTGKRTAKGSGRRTYEPIVIRKRIDKTTPFIARALRRGKVLPRVVLKGRDSSGKPMTVILTNVRIKSRRTNGRGTARRETVVLTYDKVTRELQLR